MAEVLAGLSVAANVIAVIQISEQVISACYNYYKTAKDAKKDIVNVINIVGGLKTTLDNLHLLLDESDDPDPRLSFPNSLVQALKTCEEALEKLATELGVKIERDLNTNEITFTFKKKLTWPWKEKQIEKILEVIEKQKSTFILAVTGDALGVSLAIHDRVGDINNNVNYIKDDVGGIKDGVENIKDGVEITGSIQTLAIDRTTTKDRKQRKEVLDWLKSCDPSTNHESARNKHEPTTGNWFIQSNTFVTWTQHQKHVFMG